MGLDSVEIVLDVEAAFGIRLEDAEAENIRTPRDLIDLVMSKVAASTSGRWTRDQVAARVQQIVVNTLDCRSAYREDARFIQDLGMG